MLAEDVTHVNEPRATNSHGRFTGLDTVLDGLMYIGCDFTSVSITVRKHRIATFILGWRAKPHLDTTMSRTLQPIEESNPGKSSGKIFAFDDDL